MTEPTKHAICSPSGASGWMRCAGWASDSRGSEAADEGTAAHELAAMCLTEGKNAAAYKGRRISVGHRTFEVNDEMVEAIQMYLDDVRGVAKATGGDLMVEQRLSLTPITGEPDVFGTSDCVILASTELIIVDLKYGANPRNKVEAEGNEQMQIYALAALEEFGMLGDFETVRMMIHQPRLSHKPEWVLPVGDLRIFGERVKVRAYVKLNNTEAARQPGKAQCKWCAHKATCPDLAKFVENEVGAEFEVIEAVQYNATAEAMVQASAPVVLSDERLGTKMTACDLIEDWIKAVRAEVERRLLAGTDVPGYKLVQGRAGARAWSDAEAAEQLFKSMRLKQEQMYEFKLISPTTAEKVLKEQPKRWAKLTPLIARSEGKPSVAPVSDKRPAITVQPAIDDFAVVEESDLV